MRVIPVGSTLIIEREWHLSSKNPYFKHAEFQAWIACRGERVVGGSARRSIGFICSDRL